MGAELGRLIHSLKEKCECGHTLQLRARKVSKLVRGEQQFEEEEYKVCGHCGMELEIPLRDRKKRVEHFDKTKLVKEPVEEKRPRRYPNNASTNPKRTGIKSSDAKTSGRSNRSSSR